MSFPDLKENETKNWTSWIGCFETGRQAKLGTRKLTKSSNSLENTQCKEHIAIGASMQIIKFEPSKPNTTHKSLSCKQVHLYPILSYTYKIMLDLP